MSLCDQSKRTEAGAHRRLRTLRLVALIGGITRAAPAAAADDSPCDLNQRLHEAMDDASMPASIHGSARWGLLPCPDHPGATEPHFDVWFADGIDPNRLGRLLEVTIAPGESCADTAGRLVAGLEALLDERPAPPAVAPPRLVISIGGGPSLGVSGREPRLAAMVEAKVQTSGGPAISGLLAGEAGLRTTVGAGGPGAWISSSTLSGGLVAQVSLRAGPATFAPLVRGGAKLTSVRFGSSLTAEAPAVRPWGGAGLGVRAGDIPVCIQLHLDYAPPMAITDTAGALVYVEPAARVGADLLFFVEVLDRSSGGLR